VLAPALDRASVEWRLGGSALLAVVGIDVRVGDLDVTVPADALDEVLAACERWVVDTSVGDAPAPWCSDWLTTLSVDGAEVDVIGGFCVAGPAGRVAVPQDLGGHLDLDGIDVPLADPAVWWWVYRAYRPAKAAMLAEVVPEEQRAAVERRLGPSPSTGTTPG
jgi:hypothetical protein